MKNRKVRTKKTIAVREFCILLLLLLLLLLLRSDVENTRPFLKRLWIFQDIVVHGGFEPP